MSRAWHGSVIDGIDGIGSARVVLGPDRDRTFYLIITSWPGFYEKILITTASYQKINKMSLNKYKRIVEKLLIISFN